MFIRFFLKFKRLLFSTLCFCLVAWPAIADTKTPKILIYGDSLSAGYGLDKSQAWVTLLQKKLAAEHYQYEVINASISGETTSGGLSRFAATVNKFKPSIIILELGANDGLRGLPVKQTAQNLHAMLKIGKQAKAKLLILGMKMPPNYGPQYTAAFSQTYADLSKKHKSAFVPFMLEGIAANPKLMQDDGLHPNAAGQPLILQHVWPALLGLLKQ